MKTTFKFKLLTTAAGLLLASSAVYAQGVDVSKAWVRPTVQGQKTSGGYMTLTARDGAQLISISTPVAGVAEVHEMKMEGDVMKMRDVPVLDLPAGKAVELRPGGYHLMLMELKQPLVKGSQVPLTLHFKDAKGVESQMQVMAPVSLTAPGAAAAKAGEPPAQHGAHAH